jgi:hypothetical protein
MTMRSAESEITEPNDLEGVRQRYEHLLAIT